MFFGEVEHVEEDGWAVNPELYHIVSRELLAFGPRHDSPSFGLFNIVPTHTEDGIPIRKLYVSNLPPKTTRTDLFGVFAQYGFIKSCWLRMGEKGPNRSPTPTYAFVTFSNPDDAHKALEAPCHEKTLRGRQLRISPADSWHQPAQDADGRVRWKPRSKRRPEEDTETDTTQAKPQASTSVKYAGIFCPGTSADPATDESNSEQQEEVPEPSYSAEEVPQAPEKAPEAEEYSILDILNRDCLTHILGFVPITDLIRSERVSKRWQTMVHDYIQTVRLFKTSWWQSWPLTTAVLRRVLARAGGALQRLHIDQQCNSLNDRTAHTIGKFCPNLEELKVVGMYTKNWNPLIYGCKQLKSISFISCSKITDSSLVQIVKNDSCIESLMVTNNTHVTGLFLTGSNPPKLNSLAFYNCYSLQGTVLCAAMDSLPHLTTLKLDACPASMWKIIPRILNKLPGLKELSLCEAIDTDLSQSNDFSETFANLTELRVLNLFMNVHVTNVVLKQISQSCSKLESLDISCCNSRNNSTVLGDEGVVAICSGCAELRVLDVSYLAGLSDGGLRALGRLARLQRLVSRGNPALSAAPLAAALQACHALTEVDVCGCNGVSEEVGAAGARALHDHPRPLLLRLAGTAANKEDLPTHKLLTVNVTEDLSNPHLRPDFIDTAFEVSSEDSFDDIYEPDFDEYIRRDIYVPQSDDELFLDDDDLNDDFEGIYAYGLHGQDIILL